MFNNSTCISNQDLIPSFPLGAKVILMFNGSIEVVSCLFICRKQLYSFVIPSTGLGLRRAKTCLLF